jgi:hypothetical protein
MRSRVVPHTARLPLAFLLAAFVPAARAGDCRVADYGATPDDDTVDTVAIQKAIDTCAARREGRVVVEGGRFLSGTLFLRDGIDLHLAGTATLASSPRMSDYPRLDGASGDHGAEEVRGRYSFIVARGVEDVRITGYGKIDGQGDLFWEPGFIDSGLARPSRPRPFPWIWFRDTKRVAVRDVTLLNAPGVVFACDRCEGLRVEGIRIRSHPRSPNTDGIQIESGRRVLIRGVDIATGDDAIVLKASSGPVEDVIVTDSFLTSDDAAFKLGTGSRHDVRRVTVSNVHFVDSRFGVALFMKDGGTYEDLLFRDVTMSGDASRHRTSYPLFFDVDRRAEDAALGRIRNVRVEGLTVTTRGNVLVQGHPGSPIEGLLLRDVRMRVEGAVDLPGLPGKPLGNALAGPVQGRVDYSREDGHLTLAHVRDLRVEGVDLDVAAGSGRAGFVLRDVKDAALERVRGRGDFQGRPLVDARGTDAVTLRAARAGPGASALVRQPEGEAPVRVEATDPQSATSR